MSDPLREAGGAAAEGPSAGGEMEGAIGAFDWSRTPLGPAAGWSPALRMMVRFLLANRFPLLLWWGPEYVCIYNDAYRPVLGAKHPGALGQPVSRVWREIWPVLKPLIDAPFHGGPATWDDDIVLEVNRHGFTEETHFTIAYSPVPDETARGGIGGVLATVHEITGTVVGERRVSVLRDLGARSADGKTAEEACAVAAKVLAAHPEDVPFALLFLADRDARSARLAAVAGMAPGQEPGAVLALEGAGAGGCPWPLAEVVRTGAPQVVTGLAARLGGQVPAGPWADPPHTAAVVPVASNRAGVPAGFLVAGISPRLALDGSYLDFLNLVSAQVATSIANAREREREKERADALAELDAAKTTFLQNVSHELRTPLTLMLGPLEDLIAAHDSDGEAGQLQMIRRNGRRLAKLVSSLLDFSRVEAGHARPQLAVTDLGTLTAQVASSFADVCRLAGLELVTACEPAWALADPAMWETVVLNLVSNAVKYTLTGSVTVRAGPAPGGGIEMCVADTGTGIAAADLPHLFDRFYRAASTAGRSAEGSGIGLALARSLVEMHDGTIEAASAPGAGTTVTVRLPPSAARPPGEAAGLAAPAVSSAADAYVDEAMQWAGDRAAPPGPAPGRDRALLLVADDNADMRAYLSQVLGARWDVATAADGGQALEAARRLRPDLLVTDVMMPVLDGLALAAAVRADPALALLPVIILSARAGTEAAGDGLAAGADDYLVKPFSSVDLVNRVAARLEAAGRDQSRRGGLAGRRDQALAALGAALAEARSADQVLQALLASPLCCLDAASGAAGVLEEAGTRLRMTFAGSIRAQVADRYHLIDINAPAPAAQVARTDEPMIVPDVAGLDPRYRQAAADTRADIGAVIIHPLHDSDGTVTGVLALNWIRPRAFTPDEVEVTRRAAAMAARALARVATVEREHQVAVALQEHLLDLGAGTTAAAVAAAYRPAGEALQVGGDWYTATALGNRCVGVSVGDVAGHGLAAAAVMSQLRSALAMAALHTAEPAGVLAKLDRYVRGLPGAMFATAAYAVVDADAGTVGYSCAGHPYPLVIDPGGGTRFLRDGRRGPLGARAAAIEPATGHAPLPAGSMLVLYTDGLVERRGESLDVGLARLAAAAASAGIGRLPAGDACAALLEAMAGSGGYRDDVAVIAVRPCGTAPGSHVDAIPADFTQMAPARARLRAWLRDAAPDPAQASAIVLCTGEALTNAIEHGSHRDPDRTVTIEAFAGPDTVQVTVSDSGSWDTDPTASRAAGRGRGLTVLHGIASRVQTTRTPRGTRVTITCRTSAAAEIT